MKSDDDALYHAPDLRFVKWCEITFAVNRGVYNTIDEKLFEAGYHNIYERRKAIVAFLEKYAHPSKSAKFYKFGQGNLSVALHQFSTENILN
ncbi:hypothetical protein P9B03_10565 [Metasolibacillus meyeri]|uniref:Uncharacterized protein n=1 Tax=Metasolibacillus meyeri TaxID=1071052 RepID=A0AAW9NQY6_9BACL|nr:hypothetical protein [Metasolibacillus meyeri]MEC1178926.1 hypothetical protein [Metasolibacillus meyeri]